MELEDIARDFHGLVHLPTIQGAAYRALQGLGRGRPGEHGLALQVQADDVHGVQAAALGHGEIPVLVECEQREGRMGQHGAEHFLAAAQVGFALAQRILLGLALGNVPGRDHAERPAVPENGIPVGFQPRRAPSALHAR